MPEDPPKKKQVRWRLHFRRVRITCLFTLLLVVAAVVWLNQYGLPDLIKGPLLKNLSDRGVDLQFTRLRLRFARGFVADNVVVGPPQPSGVAPQFSAREVAIQLNRKALLHGSVKADSLIVTGGKLVWQLEERNQPVETLLVTNIQTQLRFLPNDQWNLDNFTAAFAGARMRLSGSLTNASSLREWMSRPRGGQPNVLREHLREIVKTSNRITFGATPELDVIIRGDARDVQSFNAIVSLDAPDARTPWGELSDGSLLARLIPPGPTNAAPLAECRLHAGQVETRWGSARHFQLEVRGTSNESLTNLIRAQLEMSADQIVTRWAQATNAHLSGFWTHSLSNAVPLEGTGELRLANATTRWGAADEIRFSASLATPPAHNPPLADTDWGWWATLEPYVLDWRCYLENIHADEFKSKELSFRGSWRAPELTITNLHTEMYQGQFNADANLNVATRLARFSCASDFDVQKATPLLTPGGRDWFKQQEFAWEQPPSAHATGSVLLPAWTNRPPDWHEQIRPTLQLQGDFKVGTASYHFIPVISAKSHFAYSNMIWNLPDLVAVRPEGKVEILHISNDRTKDYYFRVRSTVDLKTVRPLLPPKGQQVLDEIVFTQPPILDAELWGKWHNYDQIGAKAQVTISNFSYRGESATSLHATLQYTNRFLTVIEPRVERATNVYASAAGVGFDFDAKKGYLTNGFSTMPPKAILVCLGPKIARHVEPYKFLKSPTVKANGVIPLSDDTRTADLHFVVEGGPFEWLKFHSRHVSGLVDWVGKDLRLTNLQGEFYGGTLTGVATFDFRRKDGADFQFDLNTTNCDLRALLSDVSQATNHLEGTLTGHLNITKANTEDIKSWFGWGHVDLRNGLIWDVPIFGILTPVLDSFSPGLGTTRLSAATADFAITNSVIRSENLDLRSPTLRLLYRGTVDFNLKVDAIVEADVGHDMPLVGPIINLFSKPFGLLFKTRVTGTITDPKREPLLLGKLLSPFLHPWQTLKDLIPGESGTDAPPIWPHDNPQP